MDTKILQALQSDGRLSNAAVAQLANTSTATCHRKIQRLFKEGFITAVRALVAPRKVGLGTLIFLGVVLDRSTPESFASFEAAIRRLPMIIDCHVVAGDFDYFIKIRANGIDDFNRLHAETLLHLPGVRQTRTFFVLKEVVDNMKLDFPRQQAVSQPSR